MTPPILIVLPLSAADLPLAASLLTHIAYLGPVLNHGILFVADKSLTREQTDPIVALAQPLFPEGGEMIHCAIEVSPPYPHAHNLRFETAARHIAATRKAPFLWLDPRCVPTRKSWLMEIETEYRAHAHLTPVMGHLLTPEINGTAEKLVATPAVYPAELSKRVYQRLVSRRDMEWEKSCADLLVPLAHPTLLIWTHALNGTRSLPAPPSTAALVQTQMARDYAAVVRGEKVAAPEPPPLGPQPLAVAPTPAKAATKSAYYHSGNLGDVIYALSAIKLAGGGKLLLGPRQKRTSPCSNPIKADAYDLFAPLLAVQPYVPSTAFIDRYPGTDQAFDLNRFRVAWEDKELRSKLNLNNIAAAHAHTLGVLEKWHPSQTWLTVPGAIHTGLFTVHRSARYRSVGDDAFPWPMVVKRFAKRLLFVGLASEHADFQKEFKVRVAFWQAQDFLELARIIAGSLGFIGNQSFPCSIAIGCGQRVLQESWPTSADCLFPRGNFLAQPFAGANLEAWEASSLSVALDVKKKVPSILSQTRWNTGFYKFSVTESANGIVHFNPGIAEIRGQTYLFTRRQVGDPRNNAHLSGVSVWKSTAKNELAFHAVIDTPRTAEREHWEDPRVFQRGEKTYLSCAVWSSKSRAPVRQVIAPLSRNLDSLGYGITIPVEKNGVQGAAQQKNWTFFSLQKRVFLLYSVAPFHVFELDAKWNAINSWKPQSNWNCLWPYGNPRGGTPPIRRNGEFVVFFHSSMEWRHPKRRYYAGALTFNAEPPFTPLRCTTEPILTGSECDPRTLGGPCVVFPGGAILRGAHYLISYGVNDEKCGWLELPFDDLEKRLVKV